MIAAQTATLIAAASAATAAVSAGGRVRRELVKSDNAQALIKIPDRIEWKKLKI